MLYVVDTCSLNKLAHYPRDVFPSFWSALNNLVDKQRLTSVREVLKEMERWTACPQDIMDWLDSNKHIFETPSEDEMKSIREILAFPSFQRMIGKRPMLEGTPAADPWIVAKARVLGACVITEEKAEPGSAKIPNVCEYFGVECLNLEGLLRREQWKF